jgi:hypothetical protein
MKTGIAFLAFSVGIFLYIWSAISVHALNIYNDKTIIGSAIVVGLFFGIVGAIILIC